MRLIGGLLIGLALGIAGTLVAVPRYSETKYRENPYSDCIVRLDRWTGRSWERSGLGRSKWVEIEKPEKQKPDKSNDPAALGLRELKGYEILEPEEAPPYAP